MNRTLSILFTIVSIIIISSCNDPIVSQLPDPIEKNFPEDYLGIYKGELDITTSNGLNSIPMEFHLKSTPDIMNYTYTIIYDGDSRNYNLKRTHNPNLFLVDENNGIILETAYANKTLFSTYAVMGNFLNSTQVFHDDHMEFMITMARVQDTSKTGSVESAFVTNYPISVMQKAVLYKQKDSITVK